MKTTSLKIALFFVTSLGMLAILSGLLIYKNTLISLGVWNDSNKMLVFLKVDLTEIQKNQIISEAQAMSSVSGVQLVDRLAAGLNFQKSLKEYANGLVTQDELIDLIPETIEIELESNLNLDERRNAFEKIATQLKSNTAVDDISYSSNWIEKFSRVDQFIRSTGLFVFLLLTALMSFLVSLMMRVYIDDSKSEIEVYNLLGATRWSIYKLYLKDLILFLVFSFIFSVSLSLLLFYSFKKFLSQSGLSNLISNNIQFLRWDEIATVSIFLILFILSHSYLTISSSVNKLNQINNE